jgi:hypothetical protein
MVGLPLSVSGVSLSLLFIPSALETLDLQLRADHGHHGLRHYRECSFLLVFSQHVDAKNQLPYQRKQQPHHRDEESNLTIFEMW